MRKYFLFLLLSCFITVASQVGVNTANPRGVFHIDSKKNNPETSIPSELQAQDDFIVNPSGNVGIGT